MSVKSKALVLAQLQAAATALSLMYDGAATPGTIATELRDPRHPLRNINKLFRMSNGGNVTVNTEYLDRLYNVAGTLLINNAAQPSGGVNSKVV